VNPTRKLRLPHVFGTDNRLLPYSSATARGTLLIQQFPLLQDRSRNNNNNNNNRSSSGSRGGSGGLGSSRFARGWADGASDLLGDLQRGRPRAPARGDRKNSVSAPPRRPTPLCPPPRRRRRLQAPVKLRGSESVSWCCWWRRFGAGRGGSCWCASRPTASCAPTGAKAAAGKWPVQRTEPLLRYKLHS